MIAVQMMAEIYWWRIMVLRCRAQTRPQLTLWETTWRARRSTLYIILWLGRPTTAGLKMMPMVRCKLSCIVNHLLAVATSIFVPSLVCQVEDLEESNDVVDTPNAVADANMHVLQTGDDSPPSILCNTAAAARGAENAQSRQQNVNIRHDDRSPNSIRLRYSRNAGPTSSVESVGRLIGEHPLHPDFVVR